MPFGRSAIQSNVIALFLLQQRRRMPNEKDRRHFRAAAERASTGSARVKLAHLAARFVITALVRRLPMRFVLHVSANFLRYVHFDKELLEIRGRPLPVEMN
jgi:hypothetical protein